MKHRRLPGKRPVRLGGEEIKVGWRKDECGGGWGSTLIGDGDDIKDDWREERDLHLRGREEDAGLGAGWDMG